MLIPEKLINFRVFENGADQLGLADVTLPTLEAITNTIKGAGLAGEIDSPVLGHIGSAKLELNWRTLDVPAAHFAAPKSFLFDIREANQVKDTGTGEYVIQGIKVVVRGAPTTAALGKGDMGTTSDTKTTIEVDYIKVTIDGKEVLEADKYNYIFKVEGKDYLKDVATALGL